MIRSTIAKLEIQSFLFQQLTSFHKLLLSLVFDNAKIKFQPFSDKFVKINIFR